jgi:hypothetical protein
VRPFRVVDDWLAPYRRLWTKHLDALEQHLGWHLCLDVAKRLLDGEPIGPIRGSAAMNFGWDDLRAGYAPKMGLTDTN